MLFVVHLLFNMAPKHSAEVLSSVSMHKEAYGENEPYGENTVLGKLCPGIKVECCWP